MLKNIYVAPNGNTHSFYVVRKRSGSEELEEEEDFSYLKCFQNASRYEYQNVYLSFRTAVMDDIEQFKVEAWKGKSEILCPISGATTSTAESNVDHHPIPFRTIVEDWCKEREFGPNNWPETQPFRGETINSREFVDKTLEADFREHHKKVAQLRIVNKVLCEPTTTKSPPPPLRN